MVLQPVRHGFKGRNLAQMSCIGVSIESTSTVAVLSIPQSLPDADRLCPGRANVCLDKATNENGGSSMCMEEPMYGGTHVYNRDLATLNSELEWHRVVCDRCRRDEPLLRRSGMHCRSGLLTWRFANKSKSCMTTICRKLCLWLSKKILGLANHRI